MIEFDSHTFKTLNIPSIRLLNGEMIRLEAPTIRKARDTFKKISKLNFTTLKVGKNVPGIAWYSSVTVREYLEKSPLSTNDITSYCNHAKIPLEDKLIRLSEGRKNTVMLLSLSGTNESLLISTVGMYLACLEVSYEILSNILDKGGCCIEVTYPPFDGDELERKINSETYNTRGTTDRLSQMIGSRLKVVKI